MASIIGDNFKVSIFGQSHGEAIGTVIDGFPAGFSVDVEKLQNFLNTRAPGGHLATPRKEADKVEFLSGIVDGVLCGAPLAAIIRNTNTRSGDYKELMDVPRPGHADYTAQIKYGGAQDVRGGGHFSGRLTAPLCIAGGIARQILEAQGIKVYARIKQIGAVKDIPFFAFPDEKKMEALDGARYPVYGGDSVADKMMAEIETARNDLDSVGGIIECAVFGLPAGLGEPMFDGAGGVISKVVFGIPAVKGIEFGSGFSGSAMRGSENNDPFYYDDNGNVKTSSNNHGGILGGITSGMPLYFSVAIKPTPSIAKTQQSISFSTKENTELNVKGRHDPCIVARAVPCVISAAALAVYDMVKKG
jgi:chorismate synthase